MTCCQSTVRTLENVPLLGHLIAACYACSGNRAKAERAALKSTAGILLAPVSVPAEAIDEATRERCERLVSRPLTPRADWMRRHQRKILRSLCLPGAHAAGMHRVTRRYSRWPLVDGWALCQKQDVYHQLVGGVRFLDVRLVSSDSGLHVMDDAGLARGSTLRDMLTAVKRFVTEHPSEIIGVHLSTGAPLQEEGLSITLIIAEHCAALRSVIVASDLTAGEEGGEKVSSGGEGVDWAKVKEVIHEFLRARLIPEVMRDMVIGDIVDQGRNVFICGAPESAKLGWTHTPLGTLRPKDPGPAALAADLSHSLGELLATYHPSSIVWYRAECAPSAANYANNMGGIAGLLAKRYDSEKYEFLSDLASAANACVLLALNDVTRLPFDVITTDYVHDDVIERIVQLNESPEAEWSSRLDESMMASGGLRFSTSTGASMRMDDSIVRGGRMSSARLDESTAIDEVDNALATAATNRYLNASTATGITMINSSFDIRPTVQPPLHVRDSSV